jgi:hypothetical protein
MEEVVPDAAMVKGLTRSSILTQRRRVRVPAQTGISYSTAPGKGGGSRQIQFVIADAGGLLDPASVNVLYNIQVSSTTNPTLVVADDGHPFTRVQVSINGAMCEDVAQAAKYTNMEVKLGTDQDFYKNEGSFCGFGLLNPELNTGPAPAAYTTAALQAYSGAWADIPGNIPAANARQTLAPNTVVWNPFGGEQRILPLGLVSGLGRMDQYIPLSVMGELNITLFTGQPGEVVFQTTGTDGDFSLNGVFLEYDVVIGHPMYQELLHKMGNDPNEQGINLPFESVIMASSGTIGTGTTLSSSSVIVSRATQNLLRTMAIFQPSNSLASYNFPIQSCFGHCGVGQFQVRVGSQYFPQQPATGDAGMFAATMTAYGSAGRNTSSSVINRNTWGTYTLGASGTLSANEPVLPANQSTTYATGNHLAWSDSFVPAYGFRVVKGVSEKLDLDGVSLSGASGSQLVWEVYMAPNPAGATITPTIALVALRFLSAHGGSVRIIGA